MNSLLTRSTSWRQEIKQTNHLEPTIDTLRQLLADGETYLRHAPESELQQPYAPGKWSRKQVVGHLIDSALNNLQRFTEIHGLPQPYVYREYQQDELVAINGYHEMDSAELIQLWLSLNRQIIRVMASATEPQLERQVLMPDGTRTNLRYLMQDYPLHLAHHLQQILPK